VELESLEITADDPRQVATAPSLTCYALNETAHKIVPAPLEREWAEAFPDRHPYRCLPLAIANCYGWHLLCPGPIEIDWNGGPEVRDIKIRALKPLPWGRPVETFCRSNFSHGIVTMQVDYLFETPRGWDLMVGGPANHPKENAYPLSAIVETAWLPYPFAMNWQIMRPGRVVFEEDEPFCSIYPMQKNPIVAVQPEIRRLSDNPGLQRKARAFRAERDQFHARLHAGDPEARKEAWNKQYFIGELSDGTRAVDHLTKLRVKAPVDKRQAQYGMPFVPYRVTIK
jgi:hypothetical protein